MSSTSAVESLPDQIAQSIAAGEGRRFIPVGGRSKMGLALRAASAFPVTEVDLTEHRGIVAYEPSEFLITARAGTTISELQRELAGSGQFLPCDPLFSDAGATVGGTVASGISGSTRLLYGSLRDFVMEVQFIDGLGQVVRGGGKVVKNAAGFDLPKLMVGSYGRLGIMTELTLKVYPTPTGSITLLFSCSNLANAVQALQRLTTKPLPLAALDIYPQPDNQSTDQANSLNAPNNMGGWLLAARFCAPLESLDAVALRAEKIIGQAAQRLGPVPFTSLRQKASEEAAFWLRQANFVESQPDCGWSVRVATGPADLTRLDELRSSIGAPISAPQSIEVRYTGAGSLAWLRGQSVESLQMLDNGLKQLGLSGVVVISERLDEDSTDTNRDNHFPQAIGETSWKHFAQRIQRAIDPQQRFLSY